MREHPGAWPELQGGPDVQIIAHNPGLHELALALISSGARDGREALASNLPTAAAAIVEFAINDWSNARFRSGKLDRFVSPKLLREWSGSAE